MALCVRTERNLRRERRFTTSSSLILRECALRPPGEKEEREGGKKRERNVRCRI